MSGFGLLAGAIKNSQTDRFRLLTEGIAARGTDGLTSAVVGEVGLFHAKFATTPEAEREVQPRKHVSRSWWLVSDARIDNRNELSSILVGKVEQPLDTDADFLLASYERWGSGLVDHIVGDFGFAIWDDESRTVIVARDPMGIRPVFWAVGEDESFVVSSTISATLKASALTATPDLVYLAEHAEFESIATDRSPWAEVHRLPGGHILTLQDGKPLVRRYWAPPLASRDVSVDVAAAEIRRLFYQAVECRLRSNTTVAIEVSGGFDSTSVAAAAVDLVGGRRLRASGMVFPGMRCDETEYIDAASEHLGLHIRKIDATAAAPFDFHATVGVSLDVPPLPDTQYASRMNQAAAADGCRVVLTGLGGDQVLQGNPGAVPGILVRAGHPILAFSFVRSSGLSRLASARKLGRLIGRHAVRSQPNGWLARSLAASRGIRAKDSDEQATYSAAALLAVGRPVAPPRAGFTGIWAETREERAAQYLGSAAWFVELWDRTTAAVPIESRHPFTDIRLVEYVLSLSEQVVAHGMDHRGLHRKVMGHSLPTAVLRRTSKAEFSEPWHRAALVVAELLETQGAFDRPDVCAVIDVQAVRAATTRIEEDLSLCENTWPWWGAVSVAAWLSWAKDDGG